MPWNADTFAAIGAPEATTPASASTDLDGILKAEGAEHLKPVVMGIYGQESGGGSNPATSKDGARGGMQVMPDTFRRFARAGENIDNPADNLRVGVRLIKSLGDKFNNDPGRIATGYFSGEGNVNPTGDTAYRNDRADGNGKRVSSYVADVLGRLVPSAQAALAPGAAGTAQGYLPWDEVAAKSEFRKLSDADKDANKRAYFVENIAPQLPADAIEANWQQFQQDTREPGMLERGVASIKSGLGSLGPGAHPDVPGLLDSAIKGLVNPGSVMDGYQAPGTEKAGSILGMSEEGERKEIARQGSLKSEQLQRISEQGGVLGQVADRVLAARGDYVKKAAEGTATRADDLRIGVNTAPSGYEQARTADREYLKANKGAAIAHLMHENKLAPEDAETEYQRMLQFGVGAEQVAKNRPEAGWGEAASTAFEKTGYAALDAAGGFGNAANAILKDPDASAFWRKVANDANDRSAQVDANRVGSIEPWSAKGVMTNIIPSMVAQTPTILGAGIAAALKRPDLAMTMLDAGLAQMGAQQFGAAYSKGDRAGLDAGRNLQQSFLTAVAEVAPEKLSLNALFKVFKKIGVQPSAGMAKGALLAFAKFEGTEIATEELTTIAEHFIDKAYTNPNKSLASLWDDMKMTALVAGVQAPMMAGVGVAGHVAGKGAGAVRDRVDPRGAAARDLAEAVDSAGFAPLDTPTGEAGASSMVGPDGRIDWAAGAAAQKPNVPAAAPGSAPETPAIQAAAPFGAEDVVPPTANPLASDLATISGKEEVANDRESEQAGRPSDNSIAGRAATAVGDLVGGVAGIDDAAYSPRRPGTTGDTATGGSAVGHQSAAVTVGDLRRIHARLSLVPNLTFSSATTADGLPEREAALPGANGRHAITRSEGQSLSAITHALSGRKLVFLEGANTDGFILTRDRDFVYLNTHTAATPLALLGHEVNHAMEQDAPDVWAGFVEGISGVVDTSDRKLLDAATRHAHDSHTRLNIAQRLDDSESASTLLSELLKEEGRTREWLVSEVHADLFGDAVHHRDTWTKFAAHMAKTNIPGLKQFVSYVDGLIGKLDGLLGTGDFNSQYFVKGDSAELKTNLALIRDEAAKALAGYAQVAQKHKLDTRTPAELKAMAKGHGTLAVREAAQATLDMNSQARYSAQRKGTLHENGNPETGHAGQAAIGQTEAGQEDQRRDGANGVQAAGGQTRGVVASVLPGRVPAHAGGGAGAVRAAGAESGRGIAISGAWAGDVAGAPRYGNPQKGAAEEVVAVHFSREQRDSLSGAHYGQGIKGAEALRLSLPSAKNGIQKRVYFYIDEGRGVRPEPGVGAHAHAVRLANLYDVGKDALGIWAAGEQRTGPVDDSRNWREAQIVARGFDGYYSRAGFGDQGVAVVLGSSHTAIPVKHLGANTAWGNPPAKPAQVDTGARKKALLSKEIRQFEEREPAIKAKAPSARLDSGNLHYNEQDVEALKVAFPDIRFSPARVMFEVAPDPNDTALKARWDALSGARKFEISERVTAEIMPKIFSLAGVTAELQTQIGGYLDDSNPSFAAVLEDGASAQELMDVVRLAGFALRQDAMMAISESPFEGSFETGIITVNLPDEVVAKGLEAVHDVYRKLRALSPEHIQGHSTVGNEMMLAVPLDQAHRLGDHAASILPTGFHVDDETGHLAFPEKKEYDYGSDERKGTSELLEKREDARRLRAEASAALEAELAHAEARGPDQGGTSDEVVASPQRQLTTAFTELARDDESFQLPRSRAKTLPEVMAEVAPMFKVKQLGMVYPDAQRRGVKTQFRVITPDGQEAMAYQTGDRIWLNAYNLKSQVSRGSALYAALFNYAYNNDLAFQGDPDGVSDIAIYRRTENMLSSALKFGTTRHMLPAGEQMNPVLFKGRTGHNAGVLAKLAPMAWEEGDDTANLDALLRVSYTNSTTLVPEIKNAKFDYGTGSFRWSDDSRITSAEWGALEEALTERLLGRDAPVAERPGLADLDFTGAASPVSADGSSAPPRVTTLKRAVLAGTVLRGAGEEGGRDVLDQFLGELRGADKGELKGILYSPQRDYEIHDSSPPDRTLDRAGLTALRRAASYLERPRAGIYFHITEDGRALATGPKGARIPPAFIRFAEEKQLKFEARRIVPQYDGGATSNMDVGITKKSKPMPVGYREAGARYFGESGATADRTDKVRFSPQRFYSQLERAISQVPERLQTQSATQWAAWLQGNAAKLGVKKEEIQWSGITDYLALRGKEKVSAAEIQAFLAGNGVKVHDVVMGVPDPQVHRYKQAFIARGYSAEWSGSEYSYEDANGRGVQIGDLPEYLQEVASDLERHGEGVEGAAAKYSGYVVPGGSNYRELLITLPINERQINGLTMDGVAKSLGYSGWHESLTDRQKEHINRVFDAQKNRPNTGNEARPDTFNSDHFDQPNILAHLRFDDRTDAGGNKVLFIHEIQSDWGQAARKNGLKLTAAERLQANAPTNTFAAYTAQQDLIHRGAVGVSPAPFITDTKAWVALALKRAIIHAVEGGYDKVALINGEQAAGLYDLSKSISRVVLHDNSSGGIGKPRMEGDFQGGNLTAYDHSGKPVIDGRYIQTVGELEDNIGKDAASKLLNAQPREVRSAGLGMREKEISGLDLKVGGEGMKAFYDSIVPQVANDVLRKIGGGKVGDVVMDRGGMRPHPDGMDVEVAPETQPGFPITNAMREQAAKGLPLFSPLHRLAATRDRVLARVDAAVDGLSGLPDIDAYHTARNLTMGRIARVDAIAAEVRKTFAQASDTDKTRVYEYLTTRGASASMITDGAQRAMAERVKTLVNYTGDQLVARGLIDQASRDAYRDQYLPRLYLKHLMSDKVWSMIGAGKKPSDLGYTMKREDIPPDVRDVILGEVKDPEYLSVVAVSRSLRDMAILDWIESLAQNTGWVYPQTMVDYNGRRVSAYWLQAEAEHIEAQAEFYTPANKVKAEALVKKLRDTARHALAGIDVDHKQFKQIPNSKRYGMLRGMYVREEIYNDLMGMAGAVDPDPSPYGKIFGLGHIGTKSTQAFKTVKVALNPPGQIRNFVSNMLMLQMSGIGFHMLPVRMIQAVNEIRTDGPYWKVAKKYGVTGGTFSANELYRAKDAFLALQKEHNGNPFAYVMHAGRAIANAMTDAYQFTEALGKVMKIIDEMKKGRDAATATMEANKWLFDYSLVPKVVRELRNAPIGAPFITYQVKVLPRMLEVATTKPWRLLPYITFHYGMYAMAAAAFGADPDDFKKLKKALPEWLRDNPFAVPLPWKDDDGRVQFFDMSYLLPFSWYGKIASHTGSGEPVKALQDVYSQFSAPVLGALNAMMNNHDNFTRKEIANKGDPASYQVAAYLNYVWDLVTPPMIGSHGVASPMGFVDKKYGGKMVHALTGTTNKFGDAKSTVPQAAWAAVGMNAYSVDPEHSQIQNILIEYMGGIADAERALKAGQADRSLSDAERRKLTADYLEKIKGLADDLRKYQSDSQVPDALKARK